MSWCPSCKVEYQSGFQECKKCGTQLVELHKQEPEDQPRDLGPATFLISVTNEHEANLIDSILIADYNKR